MKTFFSKSTLGFYPENMLDLYVEAGTLPTDAIEVSDDRMAQVREGMTNGATVASDDDGLPITIFPLPTTEQLTAAALAQRDSLIRVATLRINPLQDAVDLGDATTGEEAQLRAWKQYRVAVNRVLQQAGFPATIDWPAIPGA